MMAVAIKYNGGNLEIGTPRALFASKINAFGNAGFVVSKDGRFLIPVLEQGSAFPMTLVVNWQADLKKQLQHQVCRSSSRLRLGRFWSAIRKLGSLLPSL